MYSVLLDGAVIDSMLAPKRAKGSRSSGAAVTSQEAHGNRECSDAYDSLEAGVRAIDAIVVAPDDGTGPGSSFRALWPRLLPFQVPGPTGLDDSTVQIGIICFGGCNEFTLLV